MSRWLPVSFVFLVVFGASVRVLSAADEKYPKVNVALGYEVDASWPKKPGNVEWGMMPGVAVNSKDHVYLFTRAEPPVQVFEASGKFVKSWGGGKDGIGSAHHIKIDKDDNVWIADIGHHVVQKCSPDGKVLLTLGTKDHPGCDETHMDMPTDMAIAPSGDIFVSDGYGNARVVHFDKNGKYVKAWGKLGSKKGEFSIPHAIACIKDRVYVADRNNVRIQVFDHAGKVVDVWNNVITPWGFTVTRDDELWVCGSSPMQWRADDIALGCPPKDQVFAKFTSEGKLLQLWTVPKGIDGLERPGECNWVHGIALDSRGNIYVGDIKGKKAQKFVRKEP